VSVLSSSDAARIVAAEKTYVSSNRGLHAYLSAWGLSRSYETDRYDRKGPVVLPSAYNWYNGEESCEDVTKAYNPFENTKPSDLETSKLFQALFWEVS
jgi:hypothetical protein